MNIEVVAEVEVMREVAQILLKHLNPAKVARFWASWQVGQGNYLDWRDEHFAKVTVDDLYEEVFASQQQSNEVIDKE